jgi:hypothetical protein
VNQHVTPDLTTLSDFAPYLGSPSSESHISRSITTASTYSAVGSPSSAAANSGSLADPSADLQLFIDLFFYPLQQLPSSESSPLRSAARQHSMVLRPRLPKTALLIASIASSAAPISRVMSSPTSEPIGFSDADKYEA